MCCQCVEKCKKKSSKQKQKIAPLQQKLAIHTPKPVSTPGSRISAMAQTQRQTNRTPDITDRRLNQPNGQFSENQTKTVLGLLPSVRQNNLVLTMTMRMRMKMTMTVTMTMSMTITITMTMMQLYSPMFTNLVGRDKPVVSLGTYSEFT